VSFLAI